MTHNPKNSLQALVTPQALFLEAIQAVLCCMDF
jgi:hypothetical protein